MLKLGLRGTFLGKQSLTAQANFEAIRCRPRLDQLTLKISFYLVASVAHQVYSSKHGLSPTLPGAWLAWAVACWGQDFYLFKHFNLLKNPKWKLN